MAEGGSFDLGHRLDIKHILSEAKHRWLRPAEVCEVLRNQEKFHISAEAPNKPVSGSVFLFDRKVLRYFRKDGHNWRKKKDGKTVKEAHEKLKVGSVDMLNCYYAHGEDNENFQRRSYWLLEQDLMHIVFVHYMEVKGNKTNISCVSNSVGAVSKSENGRSLSSSFRGTSPTSTLSSTCDDAESGGYHQAHSRLNSYPESPLTEDSHSTQSSSCTQLFSPGEAAYKQGSGCFLPVRAKCQTPNNEARPFYTYPEQEEQSLERNIQMFPSNEETDIATNPNLENGMTTIGNGNYSLIMKKPLGSLRTDETLKKVDSFSSWIANELGEVDELDMQPSDAILWNTMGSEYEHNMAAQLHMDTHMLNPSISLDQIFSISDFLPNWAYSNLETKVLISGIFLKSEQELAKYRWSVMFGEVEVPAEVLMDGILSCCAPRHIPGVVPFYVTCSNRLACSELREFEYRSGPEKNISSLDVNGYIGILMHLYQRFEMILCLEPVGSPLSARNDFEKQSVINKIVSLIEEDNSQDAKLASESNTLCGKVIGEQLLQKQLKEKFYSWLLLGVTSDGKGLMIIDKWGQSVLHLAAALGFNWAFQPIIESGVSIDFRDVNGWTALHWAAFYGREETVAVLVSLGAAPGALTDPSTEYPQGRTPSDLSYSSGHKGISGFLGETFLTTHLSTLTLNDGDTTEESGLEAIQTVTARLAVPTTGEDVPETLSLKDSIAAVCNATQAAARIHQIFRIQSFQRKQLLIEQESGEWLDSDKQAISLLAAKTSRLGQSGGTANAAALSIQKKYRGWKRRKEFLLIRQKIVKIQAHVRGHQARKKYKPIIWSVGILEKVILRWRRKGTGLRGFRPDGIQKEPNEGNSLPPPEDDYDYLKEGRKQSEQRMQKALARVKSMAQYPEARAQYRRLLTAGEVFRESKDASDGIPDNMEDLMYPGDDLIDISSLLDDDTFMPLAF